MSPKCNSLDVPQSHITLLAVLEKIPVCNQNISCSTLCAIYVTLAETTTEHTLGKTMKLWNLPVLVLEVLFRERCLRENLHNPALNK